MPTDNPAYEGLPQYVINAITRFEDRIDNLASYNEYNGSYFNKSYEQVCKEYDSARENLRKAILRFARK